MSSRSHRKKPPYAANINDILTVDDAVSGDDALTYDIDAALTVDNIITGDAALNAIMPMCKRPTIRLKVRLRMEVLIYMYVKSLSLIP